MKKESNSSSIVNLLKTIFKPKNTAKKNGKPERVPNWMYRNE